MLPSHDGLQGISGQPRWMSPLIGLSTWPPGISHGLSFSNGCGKGRFDRSTSSMTFASSDPVQGPAPLLVDFVRDGLDGRVADEIEHDHGPWRLDIHDTVVAFEDVDVAGEENADGRLGLQGLVRQGRVARAQNEVGLALDPELLFESGLDVD